MAAEPVTQDAGTPATKLTPEERRLLAELGVRPEDVLFDPALRYAGAFADDPEFLPMMRRIFRESPGRDMPE